MVGLYGDFDEKVPVKGSLFLVAPSQQLESTVAIARSNTGWWWRTSCFVFDGASINERMLQGSFDVNISTCTVIHSVLDTRSNIRDALLDDMIRLLRLAYMVVLCVDHITSP